MLITRPISKPVQNDISIAAGVLYYAWSQASTSPIILELTKVNQKTSELTSPLPAYPSMRKTTVLERTIVPTIVITNETYLSRSRPKKQVIIPPIAPSTAKGNLSCFIKNQ